jgi:hypothetical protein
LKIVPFTGSIWRFPGGALVHRSLERYAPAIALFDAVRDEAARISRL